MSVHKSQELPFTILYVCSTLSRDTLKGPCYDLAPHRFSNSFPGQCAVSVAFPSQWVPETLLGEQYSVAVGFSNSFSNCTVFTNTSSTLKIGWGHL